MLIAASLAGNGWPVLALGIGSKVPTHHGSTEDNHREHWLSTPTDVVSAAETTADEWSGRTGCQYAAMTGQPSTSLGGLALVALDLDGDPEALEALLAEAGPGAVEWAAETMRVQRCPDRLHLWGIARASECPHTGDLAPGVEWRGSTGYVLLPGALHPSGSRYSVTGGRHEFTDGPQPAGAVYVGRTEPDDADPLGLAGWVHPLPVPEQLLDLVRGRLGQHDRADIRGGLTTEQARAYYAARATVTTGTPEAAAPLSSTLAPVGGPVRHRLDGLTRAVETAPAGQGNSCLNWAAGVAAAICSTAPDAPPAEEIRADLVAAYLARPLPAGESAATRQREGRRTVASGWRYGSTHSTEVLAERRPAHHHDSRTTTMTNGGGVVTLHTLEDDDLDAPEGVSEQRPPTTGGAITSDRPAAPVRLSDLAPGLSSDEVAHLVRLDAVPEGMRAAYLRTVVERLTWRQADTAARDLLTATAVAASGLPTAADLMRPGGDFILDAPALPVPVWGEGERVLMAEGESLMLLGRAGTGKTTIAQQWTLGRCGVPEFSTLLDLPVLPGSGTTLYLAMDRPSQARRSLRRMLTEEMREGLNDRLRFWAGPPPVDLTRNPDALGELCAAAEADSVVVDSLKDAGSVVDDEGGTGWNAARQRALVAGIAVLELHHPRKSDGDSPPPLENAYGSTWLTAGAGSVLAIGGRPGDSLVPVQHIKQPAEPVGPLKVLHVHGAGRSTVWDSADLAALAARPDGVTALEAARAIHETDAPSANQREAARRRLRSMVTKGALTVLDEGDKARNLPTRWGAVNGAGEVAG